MPDEQATPEKPRRERASKRRFQGGMEGNNERRRRELEADWVPTQAPGFFLFDMYDAEDQERISAGLKAMTKDATTDGHFGRAIEHFQNAKRSGYLSGRSSGNMGTIAQKAPGIIQIALAAHLPKEFAAVIVQYTMHEDGGYLFSYGFILAKALDAELKEEFLASEDMIVTSPNEARVREHERPTLESLEERARAWIASKLTGHFIKQSNASGHCPTVNVYTIDVTLPLEPNWIHGHTHYFQQIGASPWDAAGNALLTHMPSSIRMWGPGTDPRGGVLLYPKAERLADAWTAMHEADDTVGELHAYYYDLCRALHVLAVRIEGQQELAGELHDAMKATASPLVAKRRVSARGTHALREAGDKINTALRVVQLEGERHARRVRALNARPRRAEPVGLLPYVFTDLYKKGENLHLTFTRGIDAANARVAIELEDLGASLERDSAYIRDLYASANNLVNLRLAWAVLLLTVVTVVIGGIQIWQGV